MEKLTPEAVQEWIEFAGKNAQAIKNLVRDEEAGIEMSESCPTPVSSPCCCPRIVKLFVFAWDVDIYTAACPELID
ncbi:MAG: hypothetical protein ABFD18_07065 [Syntrophomonas sp.]